MAFTQTQLDALDTAIAQGTRTVSFDGKTVTYHSIDEMLRLRSMMAGEIAASTTPDRFSRASFSRE